MKLRVILLTVYIPFFVVFCNNKNEKELISVVKYYENGNLKSKGYLLDSLFHGEYKQYYENGNLKALAFYKNGVQDSIQIIYHNNGSVYQTAYFKNNLLNGVVQIFDSSQNIITKQFYIILNDTTITNQLITYKKNGEIDIKNSHFYSLNAKKDTISFGENYILEIKLEASRYNANMKVEIGNFDKNYNLIDTINFSSLFDRNDDSVDFKVTYQTTQYVKGTNKIKGIIYDYVSFISDENLNDTSRIFKNLFFEKEFFVK